jgi:hypothetical protein
MGNRAARRAQPQPAPLPITTYVDEPFYPPGPAYPRRGQRHNCPQYSPRYAYQYPRYPAMQPYY